MHDHTYLTPADSTDSHNLHLFGANWFFFHVADGPRRSAFVDAITPEMVIDMSGSSLHTCEVSTWPRAGFEPTSRHRNPRNPRTRTTNLHSYDYPDLKCALLACPHSSTLYMSSTNVSAPCDELQPDVHPALSVPPQLDSSAWVQRCFYPPCSISSKIVIRAWRIITLLSYISLYCVDKQIRSKIVPYFRRRCRQCAR